MNIGPFHFTGEISLGSVLTLIGLFWTCFKYLRHYVQGIQLTNERTAELWLKFNGLTPKDSNGWFNRLEVMERRLNTVWERLSFNRINIDDTRSREGESSWQPKQS